MLKQKLEILLLCKFTNLMFWIPSLLLKASMIFVVWGCYWLITSGFRFFSVFCYFCYVIVFKINFQFSKLFSVILLNYFNTSILLSDYSMEYSFSNFLFSSCFCWTGTIYTFNQSFQCVSLPSVWTKEFR